MFAAASLQHCCNGQTSDVRRWDTKDGTKALCSMEVCFLCCNLALGTLDSQDSGMGHQRTTETRPACYTSETPLQRYCIWKGGSNWIVEGAAYDHWMRAKSCISFACALRGLPSGRQALS